MADRGGNRSASGRQGARCVASSPLISPHTCTCIRERDHRSYGPQYVSSFSLIALHDGASTILCWILRADERLVGRSIRLWWTSPSVRLNLILTEPNAHASARRLFGMCSEMQTVQIRSTGEIVSVWLPGLLATSILYISAFYRYSAFYRIRAYCKVVMYIPCAELIWTCLDCQKMYRFNARTCSSSRAKAIVLHTIARTVRRLKLAKFKGRHSRTHIDLSVTDMQQNTLYSRGIENAAILRIYLSS